MRNGTESFISFIKKRISFLNLFHALIDSEDCFGFLGHFFLFSFYAVCLFVSFLSWRIMREFSEILRDPGEILAGSWRDPGEILGRSSGGDLRGCSCWGCDRDPIRILLTFQDFEILQDRFSGSLVSFHHFCLQGTFLRDLVFRIIFDTFLFSESFFNGIQFSGSDEDRFQIAVLSGNHST